MNILIDKICKFIKPALNSEENSRIIFLRRLRYAVAKISSINKWFIPTFTVFLGLLFITFILIHYQNNMASNLSMNESKRTSTILNVLSDINTQLQQLSSNEQGSENFKKAFVNMTTDLATIQNTVNELAKSSEIEKISNQLSSMQNDVDTQMLDLKKAMADSNDSKQYLDPKVLPFRIISIDVISQQPFVSIDYDNHVTPMTVGDTVAGWQITSVDYNSAQTEFKNTHDQYVKISLQE